MPAFLPGRLEVGIVVDQTPFISGPDLAARCENIENFGRPDVTGRFGAYLRYFVWM